MYGQKYRKKNIYDSGTAHDIFQGGGIIELLSARSAVKLVPPPLDFLTVQ